MKRISTLLTIGFLSFTLLTGCVAIFIPKNQTVTVNTQNDSAEVHLNHPRLGENGLVGSGKSVNFKKRKLGPKQVTIMANDYESANYVMMPVKRVNAFWPLWVLDFPLIVIAVPILDYRFGYKTVRYYKTYEFPLIHKLQSRTREQKKLRFLGIKCYPDTKAPEELNLGYKHTRMNEVLLEAEQKLEADLTAQKAVKINTPTKRIELTNFGRSVEERMQKGNFSDSADKVLKDDINIMGIEGVITKSILFKISGQHLRKQFNTYHKSKVQMTWYLTNFYGQKIDSFLTSAYSGDYNSWGSSSDQCVENAILMNYYLLFKDENFLTRIQIDSSSHIPETPLLIQNARKKVTNADEAAVASVVIKRDDKGHGSGFAISNDGYILTAYHVIAGEYANNPTSFKVILDDGTTLPGKVISYNIKQDVALIKVNAEFEYCYALTNKKSYSQTTPVYTMGAPKSIELGQSVTLGMISNERETYQRPLLQLNMSLNSGNSGGPLFEESGILHGLVVSKLVGFSTEGIGFAIPAYKISEYLNINFTK